jgi:arginine decarboxylase
MPPAFCWPGMAPRLCARLLRLAAAAGGAPPARGFRLNETAGADAAVGRVSAELVVPYPPGVPVPAPGEIITTEGGQIAYAADPTLATFQVITAAR